MTLRLVPDGFLKPSQRGSCDSTEHCSPMQLVHDALGYFDHHFSDPEALGSVAESLGTSDDCLDFSFDLIRGMTPAEALLDHRLNKLFSALTSQPLQGLSTAIRSCGLGNTLNVVARFETTFGIEMPLFLLTCRRAAEDRSFRLLHPEAEALILPS